MFLKQGISVIVQDHLPGAHSSLALFRYQVVTFLMYQNPVFLERNPSARLRSEKDKKNK